jgi:hypothetical protein
VSAAADDEADLLAGLRRAEAHAWMRRYLLAYTIDRDPAWIARAAHEIEPLDPALWRALRRLEHWARAQPAPRRRRPIRTMAIVEKLWGIAAARQAAEFTLGGRLSRTRWGALQRALVAPDEEYGRRSLEISLSDLRRTLSEYLRGDARRRYRTNPLGRSTRGRGRIL